MFTSYNNTVDGQLLLLTSNNLEYFEYLYIFPRTRHTVLHTIICALFRLLLLL